MKWLGRFLGSAPEQATIQDLAGGLAFTLAGRTQTLVEYLKKEGLVREAIRGGLLNPEVIMLQGLLFLAFPFYGMMATEFGAHSDRLRREFVKALSKMVSAGMVLEGEEEASPDEFAEVEQLVTSTLREYNEIWQSCETAGEIRERLGALAFERILGITGGSPNFKVWSVLFSETSNAFQNSIGVGKRFEIMG